MISISYIIGTHNEGKSIRLLVEELLKNKDSEDEVIIVDNQSDDYETLSILEEYWSLVKTYDKPITDFSEYKNFKKSLTKANYIFDLDGDEFVNPTLLKTLKEIIVNNHTVDVFAVPRVNIVEGITDEYAESVGYSLDKDRWVSWPDVQMRIYRNIPEIKWVNKVHEVLSGYNTITILPYIDSDKNKITDYSILHLKTFTKQKSQNELYSKIW